MVWKVFLSSGMVHRLGDIIDIDILHPSFPKLDCCTRIWHIYLLELEIRWPLSVLASHVVVEESKGKHDFDFVNRKMSCRT